ncbi:peptide ABC transporter substrate-binding protein [Enterococcus sp. CWB-B31]|uniref:peptide ABC transporter substrate-binding protein n=1 Tax=Enterococcus sp. CWB-B31 TaxID=2885159 RepID=UPI001E3E1710|nr:peptide ABC transporter substrate-binding protein [Enterococcus sp. CWB-B31]MCB5955957.1 peptide ABC transporter substrate-binding protein [Enterococcus sp. CWB-B31]
MKKAVSKLIKATMIMGMFLLFSGCGGTKKDSQKENEASPDKIINMMEINEISSMDSGNALDGGSFIAITQVMEGLFNLDTDDSIIPGVAEELPEISEDGLTYTLKLRKNAKWSNGMKVTAHDFVYAWQRVVDANYASPSSFLLMDIKNAEAILGGVKQPEELGVSAPDDYTLIVELEAPVAYFTSVMTFPTLFPLNESYVNEQGDNYGIDANHLLYNGPYVLENWEHGNQKWTYSKNDLYWNSKQSNVDKVNIQVVKETNLAVDLYENNELDRAVLSGEFAKQYKNDPDYTTQLDSWVHLIEVNQIKDGEKTIFADENARKAIMIGIDRDHIVNEILDNDSRVAGGVVAAEFVRNPESEEDFREESGILTSYDKVNAQKLWKKALSESETKEFTIDLLASDQDENKKITEYIQYSLEENFEGLTVNISLLPEKSVLDRESNQDFDLLLTRIGPDFQDPTTYLNNYAGDSFHNHSGYNSSIYNELLQKAGELSAKPKESWQVLIDAEHTLLEEAGVVPLYQSANTALMRQDIMGMIHHLFGPPNYYGKIILKDE